MFEMCKTFEFDGFGALDEWDASAAVRRCKACRRGYKSEKKTCSKCGKAFEFDGFGAIDEWDASVAVRKCKDCRRGYKIEKKQCAGCTMELPRSAYGSDDQWYSNSMERKCNTCRAAKSQHGMWKCVGCPKTGSKPKSEFSTWLAPNPKRGRDRHTRCNTCMENAAAEKEGARTKIIGGRHETRQTQRRSISRGKEA